MPLTLAFFFGSFLSFSNHLDSLESKFLLNIVFQRYFLKFHEIQNAQFTSIDIQLFSIKLDQYISSLSHKSFTNSLNSFSSSSSACFLIIVFNGAPSL